MLLGISRKKKVESDAQSRMTAGSGRRGQGEMLEREGMEG